MISKFYTVKGSRESRKGRRTKTSNVKTCKKARKKIKEKHYGACLVHQKQKRKERKKFKLKTILIKFNTSVDIRAYEENVVYCIIMGGRNNKLCDQKGQDLKGGWAGKEIYQKKSCRGSKNHFKCI